MPRIHLFEFEDQSWFPPSLRNYGTDFLSFLSNVTRMYKPLIPLFSEILSRTRSKHIIDLASGGGGALLWLNQQLRKKHPQLKITLTDYYPNLPAFAYTASQADNIDYCRKPIDARRLPPDMRGLRSQFLSLHHFKPADARQILQNAIDQNQPIAIVEGQERSVPSFLVMFFSPISLLLCTPFIRPFRWGRLFFSYLIPIVPLFVWWDGMVSCLRTYSPAEMEGLLAGLKDKDKFQWQIGRKKSGPGVLLYLFGSPRIGH